MNSWKKDAKNKIEILQKDSLIANKVLLEVQITRRSPMGAIIFETGWIFIDNVCIRILDSGSPKLNRELMK